MQKLRKAHLYLGCVFAPMILFFAVTGVLQMAGLHYRDSSDSKIVMLASSVHMEHGFAMKNGATYDWSSPAMHLFVFAMAAGLVLTTVIGVVMAFKFGKGRAAFWSLFAGVAIPALLVILKIGH